MKIKKEHNVFIKVFAYTMLLLVLMSLAAVALFSRQFLSLYRTQQQRQLSFAFQPMISLIADNDKSPQEIFEIAQNFADTNQSYKFSIQENDGRMLFSTLDAAGLSKDESNQSLRVSIGMVMNRRGNSENTYTFTGYSPSSGIFGYRELIQKGFLALGFMLLIAIFGAFLFAFKITKPLEDEIRWVRAMEENQRLFFSAASHELKTPIASARALVEGMIAGVGDYKDHPKYLRECIKTLDSQGKLVSEILEIVKLSDKDSGSDIESLDLAEIGCEVLAEYRPLAEQRSLFIEGEFPKLIIKANRNLMHRVLSNVIANAVQNTKVSGVIRIYTTEKKHLRLCVLNTGVQIPEEVLPKLFDPFYRIDTARTRGTQTGMGLAIVKKALDRMKIPFALENIDEGILFWMELPVLE